MIAIEDIRKQAKGLLESGKVRAVLGYRRSTAGLLAEPAFMTAPEEIAALVLDPTCVENLALYLVNEKKRMKHARQSDKRPLAIVAKGCDSRAITVLLQENHIKRSEVIVLGVSCEKGGMIDTRKLNRALRGKAATSAAFDGANGVKVTYLGGATTLPAGDVLADRCLECSKAYPIDADFFFGEKVDERPYGPRFTAVDAFSAEEHGGSLGLLGGAFRALHPLLRLPRRLPDVLLRRVRGRQHELHRQSGDDRRRKSQPRPLDQSLGTARPRMRCTTWCAPCISPAAAPIAANASACVRSISRSASSTPCSNARLWKCSSTRRGSMRSSLRSSRPSATAIPTIS